MVYTQLLTTGCVGAPSLLLPPAVPLLQDPAVAARMKEMQEAMSRPEVQQQMAEMQAYMQNQQVQQRMAALREDPEFKQMFEEIQTGGMGALMKYMNDPKASVCLCVCVWIGVLRNLSQLWCRCSPEQPCVLSKPGVSALGREQ